MYKAKIQIISDTGIKTQIIDDNQDLDIDNV